MTYHGPAAEQSRRGERWPEEGETQPRIFWLATCFACSRSFEPTDRQRYIAAAFGLHCQHCGGRLILGVDCKA